MRKASLVFLVIALLASVSVSAQKKKRTPAPIPPAPQMIVIQDELGEGFMVFDLSTGAYKCKLCEYGYSYSGVGSVKIDGCTIIFGAVGDGYSMTAYASLCEQKAKCAILVTKEDGVDIVPYEEVLSDPDLSDSKATCEVSEPAPVDVPSEVILQNDVDGSFLLIVTGTGEFKFVHCEDNTAMSGTGTVTRSGPWLNFEVIATEYRVLASVNLEAKTSKAIIDVFAPFGEMLPMQEIISDSNFADNVPVCGAKL